MANHLKHRLPGFLIIGAMKAGTTTISSIVGSLPGVFMPSVKEPHFLCNDAVLTPEGAAKYAMLFRRAPLGHIRGEASTGYTKLPDIGGVPHRARQVCGDELRLLYVVRHPVERAISHHYHLVRSGRAPVDANVAVREIPALLNYSRYWMQLQPWIEQFGNGRVLVTVFEDYLANPTNEVCRIAEFLGASATTDSLVHPEALNTGESALTPRPALKQVVNSVTRSQWYKIWVHPWLPRSMSSVAKSVMMSTPVSRPAPPGTEAMKYLVDHLEYDAECLQQWMQRTDPVWELGKVQFGNSFLETRGAAVRDGDPTSNDCSSRLQGGERIEDCGGV